MHEIYRTFAADIDRDRMREAAARRLADEARSFARRPSLTGRVKAVIDRLVRAPQPAPAPTAALAPDCAPCG
jgi:hypothetical protein